MKGLSAGCADAGVCTVMAEGACFFCFVQVVTQVSLILLLFGTVIGDFALLADVGQRALRRLTPSAPELLVGYDGRGIMVLLTLCVVLPLCLLRKCVL